MRSIIIATTRGIKSHKMRNTDKYDLNFLLSLVLTSFYLLIVDLEGYCCSWPHLMTRTHWVGLLWMTDRSVSETSTCTTRTVHKIQMSIPSAGKEAALTASERPHTQAWGSATTGIGRFYTCLFWSRNTCHNSLVINRFSFKVEKFGFPSSLTSEPNTTHINP